MNAAATTTSSIGPRYGGVAITFHWLLALMIIVSFSVGWYMTGLGMSPTRLKLFNWHKWAGVTILALSALRLLWRLTHRPPEEAPGPAWQQQAARWTHYALYLLFFAVPLTGWAYSSATGFPIVWFGVLPLPDFVPRDKALADVLKQVHHIVAWGLGTLVVLHIAAAVKHQFIDRDGLLYRMVPSR